MNSADEICQMFTAFTGGCSNCCCCQTKIVVRSYMKSSIHRVTFTNNYSIYEDCSVLAALQTIVVVTKHNRLKMFIKSSLLTSQKLRQVEYAGWSSFSYKRPEEVCGWGVEEVWQ